MDQRFVADGLQRLLSSEEHCARCRELRDTVYSKYAIQIEQAGFFRRMMLRYKRHRECTHALAEITPSAESLWMSGNSALLQHGDRKASSAK